MESKAAIGVTVPALGFGTWLLKGKDARRMTAAALDMGYRHIDTAQIYRNEAEVGEGLRDAGIARNDIFLTTKVWPDNYADNFQASVRESLDKLGVDQVDLLLLHWPSAKVSLAATLEQLQQARQAGYTRHIGISNHPAVLMREAESLLGQGTLLTNQAEYHALLSQETLLKEVRRQQMLFTAYCPLAQGKLLGNDTLKRIGNQYGKHEVQVALRWLLQQDKVIAIPRSSSEVHAKSNLDIFDFSLSEDDMRAIDKLRGTTRVVDPDFAPDWD
jgi:diketogulonate reductase-like aldo/keto reductase